MLLGCGGRGSSEGDSAAEAPAESAPGPRARNAESQAGIFLLAAGPGWRERKAGVPPIGLGVPGGRAAGPAVASSTAGDADETSWRKPAPAPGLERASPGASLSLCPVDGCPSRTAFILGLFGF